MALFARLCLGSVVPLKFSLSISSLQCAQGETNGLSKKRSEWACTLCPCPAVKEKEALSRAVMASSGSVPLSRTIEAARAADNRGRLVTGEAPAH